MKWLIKRDNEILKRLDLDELELNSDRLKIFMKPDDSEASIRPSVKRRKKNAVPALDFTKIYEWRE